MVDVSLEEANGPIRPLGTAFQPPLDAPAVVAETTVAAASEILPLALVLACGAQAP